ncbi:hypothetical protein Dsin_015786 [Dipteronia sinensis]|uniref:BED-type domain-containing protein n=1 Tax=Dipteronia sinensis TaxID=43782 RepID=A0AAE0ABV6_9ROSI|nr:hypothetical protein Dsin_015786 [Dipteronia sinensis]
MSNSKSESVSKGKARSDPAWKHCKEVDRDDRKYYKYLLCNYCQQEIKECVSRMKHHLPQTKKDVRKCPSVPEEVRDEMKKYLRIRENAKEAIERSFDQKVDTGSYYWIHSSVDELQEMGGFCPSSSGGLSSRGVRGPIDRFFPSKDNDNEHGNGHLPSNDANEASKLVTMDVQRYFFENGIPFNIASSPSFVSILRSVGDYGRSYKAPSLHDLSTWVLQTEVETTRQIVEDVKKTWKATGIHTKKRNRLSTTNMHKLVYIMYNKRLKDKYLRRQKLKENEDPLILDNVSSDDEWMVGEEEGHELREENRGTLSNKRKDPLTKDK